MANRLQSLRSFARGRDRLGLDVEAGREVRFGRQRDFGGVLQVHTAPSVSYSRPEPIVRASSEH